MKYKTLKFVIDDSGAVTVDWVVLTGAIVGLSSATMFSVGGGANTLADNIATELASTSLTFGTDNESSGDWLERPEVFDQYQALYAPHQADEFWVEKLYTSISELSDEALQQAYNDYYANATEGEDVLQYVDTLMVTESVFIDRGMTIPEGNEYAFYLAEALIEADPSIVGGSSGEEESR